MGPWLQRRCWRKLLADRKRVHLCLVCWCSRNQCCVRAELSTVESCFHVAFLRSRKLRLPVNFLFCSSVHPLVSERADREARQRNPANHKALTSCQEYIVDEAVSDLLLPSVSWQPVYAAEGRPVTLLRLRLRTNKECTLTQATQANTMQSIKMTGQRSQKPAFISETSSDM